MWRYGGWRADHSLPIGESERAAVGDRVNAGDVIARGAVLGTATRVTAARQLGLDPDDIAQVIRAPVGTDIAAKTVLARTGRRFARAVTAPHDGRLLQITADGDAFIARNVGRWSVRSTLDGTVTRSDDAAVTVEGDAWSVEGIAAFGPDAVGELWLGVDSANAELAPARLDVRVGGRIVVGGARVSAEALTRAHACGIAGVIGGGVPAAGLRVVYGDDVPADGLASRDDRPTVLCLFGFGGTPLPREVFEPLRDLAGSRAAIHTASARLFVFAPARAIDPPTDRTSLALADDYGAVRLVEGRGEPADETDFGSEIRAPALRFDGAVLPAPNVRLVGAPR